jgi:hypothetical protein
MTSGPEPTGAAPVNRNALPVRPLAGGYLDHGTALAPGRMNTALDIAQRAVARGWRPFPLDHPELPACIGLHGPASPCNGKRGKHPAIKWGTATVIEPPDALLATWFTGSPRNVGIACKPSGLFVIDEDEQPLETLAAELGETLPVTYRVRTRRGWHWYFLADPDGPLGNAAGGLARLGADVRGSGATYGGYVVGAGSVHESGHVYAAEDERAPIVPLPGWLVDQILTKQDRKSRDRPGRLRNARAQVTDPAGWDDDPRYGTAEALQAQYQRHLAGVQTPGGEFRHELYLAALDGWRLVDCGLRTEDAVLNDLAVTVERVWNALPDERDQHIVLTEARKRAAASPWVVVAESGDAGDGQDEPTAYERAFAAELRKERIRREVRAVLAAEDAPPLAVLSGTAFLAAPTPVALVEGLLYEDGLHQIFGADGSGKSLFALDVALSLAAGIPCALVETGQTSLSEHRKRKAQRRPLPVHYVMAEGQAVNVERAHAWLAHHNLPESSIELFTAVTTPIMLTRPGVVPYLAHVERDRPTLVILDTKIVMMEGNENQASDTAELIRAMHLIRSVNGACVWLVDHTGQHDPTRSRGGPALKAATETQHRCEANPETGLRTVYLERDKGGRPGTRWTFRLKPVGPAVVCIPVTEEDRSVPWTAGEVWWLHAPDEVPDEVAKLTGKGCGAARDVFRLLRYVNNPDGLTTAQIQGALLEGPRKHARSTFHAGIALLSKAGITVAGATPRLVALDQRYDVAIVHC